MMKPGYFLALVVAAYLLTGVYQVGPDERAVVRRFGRVVAHPGPGLGVGLPWGVDRVDRVPVRTVRQVRTGYDPEAVGDAGTPPGQMLTGDQNLVNVQLVIDYTIGETDDDLDNFVLHRDQVDPTLSRAAEAAVAEWTGGRTIDQALLTGSSALPAWVMARLAERLPDLRLGVRVQRASVALLAPPDEVRTAFEAVTQAQTAIGTKETQAKQERAQRLSQAEALRYKLEQEAAQYRDAQLGTATQIGQARADANAFLAELADYRLALEANPDALAFVWWHEMNQLSAELKRGGGEAHQIDHFLLRNGELNLFAVLDFFGPSRR